MRVLKASSQIEERSEVRGGLANIERAGRLCYKSEDKITDTSADAFVRGLIQRKHLSVLEHGDMIFETDDRGIYADVVDGLQALRNLGLRAPMIAVSCVKDRYVVSGNLRAWMELFARGTFGGRHFIGHFDPLYTRGRGYIAEGAEPDPRVRPIRYADLSSPWEKRAHLRQTVRFVVDRGVSHEFVRHRVMSFSQESTRYCNYAQARFGREITVIEPCYLAQGTEGYQIWARQCERAEEAYFALLNYGLSPQEARAVLPSSTKTELLMTGTLEAWQHFFDLRAKRVTGPAHPQAEEVAVPLYERFKARYPDVIT